jgi:small subunit ribosomal protein S18
MASKARVRGKNKDNARRSKKKSSILNTDAVEYVDYKDINLLRRFMSERAKIRARRVTGNDSQQQKEVARAIKNAREMALLPYANRVVTSRGQRGERGERGAPRADGPMPRPSAPPPPRGSGSPDEEGGLEDLDGVEGVELELAEDTETLEVVGTEDDA